MLNTTIYIDVLFCVNFIVDYILLLSVQKFVSLPSRIRRLLLGAFLGGASSFVILLPPLPFWLSWLISISEALLMTAAAFAPMNVKTFIRVSSVLFAVSFIYCGFMTAVLMFFSPSAVTIRNNSVYIGLSPFVLVAATLVCYGVMRLFIFLTGRASYRNKECSAVISYGGNKTEVRGIIDTGNTLHEPFSGECVIVGRDKAFGNMVNIDKLMKCRDEKEYIKGIRLVPFSSVGGNGLMPAFRPSEITLKIENKEIKVSAYLALCSERNLVEGCDILIPHELIMKGS